MVNTMLDQISNMNELVIKYAKGIEALKISTKVYKQLKQEYQPHYEFLREGQHDETLEKIRVKQRLSCMLFRDAATHKNISVFRRTFDL